MNNQKGFTLIELVVVIVILGVLAAVAVPKFIDIKTDAELATANGVFGAANAATSLNHAAKIIGKATTALPAYDATTCAGGLIINGACLENSLDGGLPDGWAASGTTVAATLSGTTYTITVTPIETTISKAGLTKSW